MTIDLAVDHIQQQRQTIAANDGMLTSGSDWKEGRLVSEHTLELRQAYQDEGSVLWGYSTDNSSFDQLERQGSKVYSLIPYLTFHFVHLSLDGIKLTMPLISLQKALQNMMQADAERV